MLVFGLGISFTAFGLPLVRRAAGSLGLTPWPAFLAISWSLVSWWPHDSLHLANGMDLGGLLLFRSEVRGGIRNDPDHQPSIASAAHGSRGSNGGVSLDRRQQTLVNL